MNHATPLAVADDIKNIDPNIVMQQLGLKAGELDLLAGCPPCQGFSKLRTRNKHISAEDVRNDLIFEYLRFVETFQPRALMLENVPYLIKDSRMGTFLSAVSALGYSINEKSASVEDASDYGVPQRRKRMIFVASRLGSITSPPKVMKKVTVREAIGNLPEPGKSGDEIHDLPVIRSPRVTEVIAAIPKDGGGRLDLPDHLQLPCHKKCPKGFLDVYGRMWWDKVSPTITGGCHNPSKGRFLHPEQNRAITLREAAALQTFPPDYKFSLRKGKDSLALMIGNALPPKFIQAHAHAIREHLGA